MCVCVIVINSPQPWYSHYLAQHVYTPLVYCFLAWKTRYQDVTMLHLAHANGAIRMNAPSQRQLALFWAGKATWFLYRIALPALYLPLWRVLLYLTIADFVVSYWLALTFQANHVVQEVDFVVVDDAKLVKLDWAAMQLRTTQDYAHSSWFWTTSTGALNYQSTHHLLPGVHQYYYPQIMPIIQVVSCCFLSLFGGFFFDKQSQRTAAEFNVRYLHKDTFTEALSSHIDFLVTSLVDFFRFRCVF